MDLSARLNSLKAKQLKLEAQLAENQAKETQVAGEALALLIHRNPRIYGALCQPDFLSQISSSKRKPLEKWLERNAPTIVQPEVVSAHTTDADDAVEPARPDHDRFADTE